MVSFSAACKAQLVLPLYVRAEQAAEKVGLLIQDLQEKIPRGLKPSIYFQLLAARLKPCPFKTPAISEFFRRM